MVAELPWDPLIQPGFGNLQQTGFQAFMLPFQLLQQFPLAGIAAVVSNRQAGISRSLPQEEGFPAFGNIDLASHILGRMAKILPRDWERIYNHPVYFLETFTDPTRFKGTCYRAANWVVLGRTTGRGNNAPTREQRVPIKEILAYPLTPRFRELLSGDIE